MDSALPHIINVFVEQSVWGRIFRCTTVTVHTRDGAFGFYNQSKPKEIQRRLMKYVDEYCARW